jgi:hypothetical protein
MSEQTVKEVAGAIFYSLISLYDHDAASESMKLLSAAIDTQNVRDPAARKIIDCPQLRTCHWSRVMNVRAGLERPHEHLQAIRPGPGRPLRRPFCCVRRFQRYSESVRGQRNGVD